MATTNFPNGVSSFGIPILPGTQPLTTGQVFFVDSNNGSNNNRGDRPDRALATVDAAISLCRANKRDRVLVMPGHAETVTATSIAHDVAGVEVIGLGVGLNRPTFTFGAAAATITVSAANGRWENCHFIANFLNVAAAFTLSTAKDFELDNCTFADTSTILNFLSAVVTGATDNAADGLKVRGCRYRGLATTENAFVSVLANLDRMRLSDNLVFKDATNNAGQFLTLSSKIILGAEIERNRLIVVGATGATVGIFLTGSGTTSKGIVADNYVSSLDTTTELIATAGTGLVYFNNYYTGDADASGKLWPVVAAA